MSTPDAMRFSFSPCRVSFVLCALLAFLTDPDHASHINIADPPSFGVYAPMKEGLA